MKTIAKISKIGSRKIKKVKEIKHSSSPSFSPKKCTKILYKLSGEVLKGDQSLGYDGVALLNIANDIAKVVKNKVGICIVVGGGNLMRGRSVGEVGIDRVSGDYMGMLATAMNAIALKGVLSAIGVKANVLSSIKMEPLCEFYSRDKAKMLIDKKEVVILATGVGVPFFSTDMAAATRAVELGCNVIIKGTSVDGVYSADPKQDPTAKYYSSVSFADVVQQKLGFIDQTAAALLNEQNVGMVVFNIKNNKGSALANLMDGKSKCTFVYSGDATNSRCKKNSNSKANHDTNC